MKQSLGSVYVLTAGSLWGLMGVFVRHFSALGLAPLDIALFRVLFGLIVVGAYLALFHRDLLKIRLRDLWCFAGTGIGSFFLLNLTYYTAMEYTSLAVAGVLLYTAPIFVMLLSALLFRETITKRKLFALCLANVAFLCRNVLYCVNHLEILYIINILRYFVAYFCIHFSAISDNAHQLTCINTINSRNTVVLQERINVILTSEI